ncbi:MAG: Y-family DNA polymerase [Beijerinckiaceae bacterium]
MGKHATGSGPERPLATIAKVKSAQRLVAVNAQAKACGLSPGMMLADARAIEPGLVAYPADARAEAELIDHIVDWCRRFTPLAALDAPDGAMLDISGAAHLFGGEAKLIDDIETRLAAQGFAARAAIAPTPEAAWALAHFGGDKRLLPDGDDKELQRRLGALPLAALRLDAKSLGDLAQAGLRRIDDILFRPRAPLTARFGKPLFARLDGLLGRVKNPISPCFEAPAYLVERRFAEPIVTREAVEATLLSLAQDLVKLLTQHGEGARRLELSLFRVDGEVKHIGVGTSRPLRMPQTMARLFHEKLEAAATDDDPLDAGYGFDVVRLSACVVERQDQDQASWLETSCDGQDLSDLIDRLGARFGLRRVTRLAFIDTHWPEFAVTAVPAAEIKSSSPSRTGRGWREAPDEGRGGLAPMVQTHPAPHPNPLPLRPIRLLQNPEPIETLASVPDGPPARFRWRLVLHEIAAIEGPERIAPEWWKDMPALTRDYFRAEDTQGRRFWLFREGLYETETARPRWFLHGLFA